MKVMYPCRLGPETKCPNCHSGIISIGGTLYSCQKGHIIECVVLVTMKSSDVLSPVDSQPQKQPKTPNQFSPQSAIQTDEPVMPPPPKVSKPS